MYKVNLRKIRLQETGESGIPGKNRIYKHIASRMSSAGTAYRRVLVECLKNGRRGYLHATKGWRSERLPK